MKNQSFPMDLNSQLNYIILVNLIQEFCKWSWLIQELSIQQTIFHYLHMLKLTNVGYVTNLFKLLMKSNLKTNVAVNFQLMELKLSFARTDPLVNVFNPWNRLLTRCGYNVQYNNHPLHLHQLLAVQMKIIKQKLILELMKWTKITQIMIWLQLKIYLIHYLIMFHKQELIKLLKKLHRLVELSIL